MMQFHFLLQDGTLWGVINTLRMDPSSNIPGATKKKKESHLGDKWTISLSEWRLRKTVQKCRFNDSPTLCSKIKSHLLLPPSWIFYTQTGWDIDSLMSTIKFPHCVLQPNLETTKIGMILKPRTIIRSKSMNLNLCHKVIFMTGQSLRGLTQYGFRDWQNNQHDRFYSPFPSVFLSLFKYSFFSAFLSVSHSLKRRTRHNCTADYTLHMCGNRL